MIRCLLVGLLRLISVVCIMPATGFGQRFDKTVLLEGKKREFIVVKPTGATPTDGYPVVFMLHGTSGDGEKFYIESGWKELGQQEKFISVFPSSLTYCVTEEGKNMLTTKWNNGDLQTLACPGQVFKDDVLFMSRMIDTLRTNFSINNRRLFVCGFSNGGVMAAKLAVEMSDVFAATVTADGILHNLDSAKMVAKIPCWLTMGTLDDRITTAIGIPILPYNDSSLFLLRGLLADFTGVLELQTQYTKKDSMTNLTFYEFSKDLSGKPTSNKFIFMLAKNMFHVFPNGTNYPFFESAPLYWNLFFKNIIKSATTPLASSPPSIHSLSVYPNPANTFIQIKHPFATSKERYFILDVQGKTIKQMETGLNDQVQIQDLTPGLYIIRSRGYIGKFIKY